MPHRRRNSFSKSLDVSEHCIENTSLDSRSCDRHKHCDGRAPRASLLKQMQRNKSKSCRSSGKHRISHNDCGDQLASYEKVDAIKRIDKKELKYLFGKWLKELLQSSNMEKVSKAIQAKAPLSVHYTSNDDLSECPELQLPIRKKMTNKNFTISRRPDSQKKDRHALLDDEKKLSHKSRSGKKNQNAQHDRRLKSPRHSDDYYVNSDKTAKEDSVLTTNNSAEFNCNNDALMKHRRHRRSPSSLVVKKKRAPAEQPLLLSTSETVSVDNYTDNQRLQSLATASTLTLSQNQLQPIEQTPGVDAEPNYKVANKNSVDNSSLNASKASSLTKQQTGANIVKKFKLRDTSTIRAIIFDNHDRRLKAITDRFHCQLSIYEVARPHSEKTFVLILQSKTERDLIRCVRSIDSNLKWHLYGQLQKQKR